MFLIVVFYILLFIFQILLINKGKSTNQNKYWIIFKSIFFAIIVSLPFLYYRLMAIAGDDFGYGLIGLGIIHIISISFVIQFVVGLIIKLRTKKKSDFDVEKTHGLKKNLLFYLLAFVITFSSILIIFGFSNIIGNIKNNNTNKSVSEQTINYLNDRYGNQQFKIINISKDYTSNGGIGENFSGYIVLVESKGIRFIVNKDKYSGFSDQYLTAYYNDYFDNPNSVDNLKKNIKDEIDKLNKYIKAEVSVSDYYYNDMDEITNKSFHNSKKVPAIEELKELISDYTMEYNLKISIRNAPLDDKKLEKLYRKLAKHLLTYYDDNKHLEFETLVIDYKNSIQEGYIVIDKSNVYINTLSGSLADKFIEDAKKYTKKEILESEN